MNLEKLKELRLRHKYSQMYVAKKIGYKDGNAIWLKENGYRQYSVKDVEQLCKLYGISIQQLEGAEDAEH